MWETLRNVWRVPELRKKVLYTFFMLLIFRLVSVIPAPGVDVKAVQEAMGQYDMLGLVNMMTGNSFGQMTIMAMGISPYINASIIMQLLTIAIPALERLQKDGGEEGKKKINRITRYVTVGLAALQAIGIIAGLRAIKPAYANFFGYMTIGIIMAGGTALAMWIGERITKNGIGNGISLLIFAGIISNLFNGIVTAAARVFNGGGMAAVGQLAIILISTLVILVIDLHAGDPGDRYLRGYGRAPHPRPVRQARGGPENVRRPEHPYPPQAAERRRAAAALRLLLHGVPGHHLRHVRHQLRRV